MADTKTSALTAITTPAGTDQIPVAQAAAQYQMTLAQLLAFMKKAATGSSAVANQNGIGTETIQTLISNASANSTTTIADVMTTTGLLAGTYYFRYDIITQSAATTTAQKFRINYSGTVTKIVWHLFFPSQGVTAATGVVDQDSNVTTGAVWAHQSARANNITLGPGTDHDATGDVHYVAEGIIVVSGSGDLALGHAGEVAASSTVQSGTTLLLRRVA